MRSTGFFRSSAKLSAVLAGIALLSAPAAAATITIDGNLSDWGITVSDSPGSTPLSNFSNLSTTIGLQASFVEDQNDNAGDGGFLGPNQGGQNYDAEFLGVALQNTTLFIAIVTGQRPDNGATRYSPGDIMLTINNNLYGIEVGGGVGGGAGAAITEGAAGSTYNVNSNGFTNGTTPLLATAAAQTAGSVWIGADWINDPIAPATPVQMKINGTSTQVGTANYVYTRNSVTSQHSIIELALDISNLLDEDGEGLIGIHWSPSCGNDIVQALFTASMETQIPEPGSVIVWVAGFGAMIGLRYRRRRRA